MKTFIRSIAISVAILVLYPTAVSAEGAKCNEHDAVTQTMEKLMQAFRTNDANLVSEVLRSDGTVLGYASNRGIVAKQTMADWAKGFSCTPAKDEAQRKRSYEIMDVTGDAAAVKLTLDYPGWDGLDYLMLSKINGKWMVVTKSWSGKTKAVAQ